MVVQLHTNHHLLVIVDFPFTNLITNRNMETIQKFEINRTRLKGQGQINSVEEMRCNKLNVCKMHTNYQFFIISHCGFP